MGARRTAKGAAIAGLAVGAALGIASRRRRAHADTVLGGHRGRSVTVTTDDGVRLAVDIEEAEAPEFVVVLAHGWVMNRHWWHFQREALAGKATLVFYDQRGHGDSSAGAFESCTIDRLGDDMAAVVEQAVPEGLPLVLVGHSMGGMTIMAFAGRHPETFAARVAGVALLSTSSGRLNENTFGLPWPLKKLVSRVTPMVFDQMLAQAAAADGNAALKSRGDLAVIRFIAFGRRASREHVRFANDMSAATSAEMTVGFFRALQVHDKFAALAALKPVETLIMVGGRDRLTPPVHSRRIAEALPGAKLVVLPDAGHMIGLERPEAVNLALTGLLDRVARRTAGHLER
ncbi:alpha/beta fold hydrolase [Streptosporangium sp. NPDC000396]|uniref:alpha/beta fold hydrolase n=1 Tax=Streptosporangium sp. NPDC000396 TaxID=3366185 RepID=UPI0036A52C8D